MAHKGYGATKNKLQSRLDSAHRRQIEIHAIPEPKKAKGNEYENHRETIHLTAETAPFVTRLAAGDEVTIALCGKVKHVSTYETEGEKPHGSVTIELYEIAEV